MSTHTIQIGAETRDLPIINVGAVSVALLNLLGDTSLTEAAAEASEIDRIRLEGER